MKEFVFVLFHVDPPFQSVRIPIGIFVTEDTHTISKRVLASKFPDADYLGRPTEILLESHIEDFQKVTSLSEMQDRGPHLLVKKRVPIPNVEDLDAYLAGLLP